MAIVARDDSYHLEFPFLTSMVNIKWTTVTCFITQVILKLSSKT